MRPIISRTQDWRELSDVGQAYGGISAILSGLAFCGIASSLLLQWRQVRLTQLLTTRERHFELVKLGLEDPSLRPPGSSGESAAEIRQWAYFNLWVSHWAMLWDTGSTSSVQLRRNFDGLFCDEAALDWWGKFGLSWNTDTGKHPRAFMAIAHEAYRDAPGMKSGSAGQQTNANGSDVASEPNR